MHDSISFGSKGAERMANMEPTQLLRTVGMQPKYKGYFYLLYMLNITRIRPELVYEITKTLYPLVMEHFSVSRTSVERSVRFAIAKTWEQGNKKELHALFRAYGIDWSPSNREFLAVLTERLISAHKRDAVQLELFTFAAGR